MLMTYLTGSKAVSKYFLMIRSVDNHLRCGWQAEVTGRSP